MTALLETTVLTDWLLKKDGSEQAANATLAKHQVVVVPQFAWKEYKRGPLVNFQWMHNKLADTKSFLRSLAALQRMSRSPRRYLTATAIQALHSAFTVIFEGATMQALAKQYGAKAAPDAAYADALRLTLKKMMFVSWDKRKTAFGGVSQKLDCYPDDDIRDTSPLLDIRPVECPKGTSCCLAQRMQPLTKEMRKMSAALPDDNRPETTRRRKLLRQMGKHPSTPMGPAECRIFGDAYFVLFCPPAASVVTTNARDIQPMADALKVKVEVP
jgi:hypothetical protein